MRDTLDGGKPTIMTPSGPCTRVCRDASRQTVATTIFAMDIFGIGAVMFETISLFSAARTRFDQVIRASIRYQHTAAGDIFSDKFDRSESH
jgi:hypothetical protein